MKNPSCRKYSIQLVLFFFSSRRRHTRYIGDWSSDVCSSDLFRLGGEQVSAPHLGVVQRLDAESISNQQQPAPSLIPKGVREHSFEHVHGSVAVRSEERRVGKERASGGGPSGGRVTEVRLEAG